MGEEMELPPYWMGCPVSIANGEGTINGEVFIHACSLECLSEYMLGEVMKEKLMLIDKENDDLYPEEDDEEDD